MNNKFLQTLLFSCFLFTTVAASAQSTLFDLVKKEDSAGLQSYLAQATKKTLVSELERKGSNDNTALIVATYQGNTNIVKSLVDAGANVHVRDNNQRDLINIAIRVKNPELVKLFIAAGVDVKAFTKRYRGSTLIFASHQGQVETVKALIKAGAPLDRINILGWTAILEAVVLGDGGRAHQEIVKVLLQAGADKTIADNDGKTPLEIAEARGHDEMVEVLKSY